MVCDEETFYEWGSYSLAFASNEGFSEDTEYEIRICAYHKNNCELNGICDRKQMESCVKFYSDSQSGYVQEAFGKGPMLQGAGYIAE